MRRLVVLGVALGLSSFAVLEIVNAIGAGGEQPPSVLQRSARPSDALPVDVRERARAQGFDISSARRIAPGTFVVRRNGGFLCVVTVARGMSGGCNPAGSFFHGQELVYGISEEGMPNAPSYLRVAGVAREEVAKVRLRFDGVVLESPVSPDGGFAVEATADDLAHGRPTKLEAIGKDGRVLGSYSLPKD
jgi:hypothetical protein